MEFFLLLVGKQAGEQVGKQVGKQEGKQADRQAGKKADRQASTRKAVSRSHALEGLVLGNFYLTLGSVGTRPRQLFGFDSVVTFTYLKYNMKSLSSLLLVCRPHRDQQTCHHLSSQQTLPAHKTLTPRSFQYWPCN